MKTIYKTLKFSITILILISSISVFGQKNLKKAEKLMDKYEYSKAAKLCEARATIGKQVIQILEISLNAICN